MKIINHHKFKRCIKIFPTEFLDVEWAKRIHGQTLERLDERGGLSPMEIFCNINRVRFSDAVYYTNEEKCVYWINVYLELMENLKNNL